MAKLVDTISDYTSIQQVLIDRFSTEDAFKDVLQSSTGRLIVQLLAATGAFLVFKAERSYLESMITTAQSKTALWSLSTTLGGIPRRKVSASVTCRITFDDPTTSQIIIPIKTSFTIGNYDYYNKEAIVIPINSLEYDFTLYQGTLVTLNYLPSGADYQRVTFGSNYSVEDDSVEVVVNDTVWEKNRYSLFEYSSNSTVYLELTNPIGTTSIIFGDNLFGVSPVSTDIVKINYVLTNGSTSNNSLSGLSVSSSYSIGQTNSIVTVSPISNGDDEESNEELRFTSPRIFASAQRAVTRNDYKAWLLRYPNVFSVNIWGEYEEALLTSTESPTMMNKVFTTIVKDDMDRRENILVGTSDASTVTYATTLSLGLPIIKKSICVFDEDKTEIFYDDGAGTLSSNLGGTGTIDYDNGILSVTFSTPPLLDSEIYVNYTGPQLSSSEKEDIIEYMDNYKHFTTLIEFRDVNTRLFNVTISAYYSTNYDPFVVRSNIETAINNYFSNKTLGYQYHKSDIYDIVKDIDGVDWMTLSSPSSDTIQLEYNEYMELNFFSLTMIKSTRA